jgi:hypothetical protein
MRLRDGINAHWIGARFFVGRRHAGGVVMTGPMRQKDALSRVEQMTSEGHTAVIAEETAIRSAWLWILNQLS